MSIYQQDLHASATPYYRMVHAKMAEMSKSPDPSRDTGDYYIVSNDIPMRGIKGGVCFECKLKRAAEDIITGTHRLATDAEIAKYIQDRADRDRTLRDINLAKKNTMIVTSSPEENDRMAAIVSSAVAAVLTQQGQGGGKQKGA